MVLWRFLLFLLALAQKTVCRFNVNFMFEITFLDGEILRMRWTECEQKKESKREKIQVTRSMSFINSLLQGAADQYWWFIGLLRSPSLIVRYTSFALSDLLNVNTTLEAVGGNKLLSGDYSTALLFIRSRAERRVAKNSANKKYFCATPSAPKLKWTQKLLHNNKKSKTIFNGRYFFFSFFRLHWMVQNSEVVDAVYINYDEVIRNFHACYCS